MSSKVSGSSNIVAHLSVVLPKETAADKTPYRLLRAEPKGLYYAKDQIGIFTNGRMKDPTMPKIMTAIAEVREANKSSRTATPPQESQRRVRSRRGAARQPSRSQEG